MLPDLSVVWVIFFVLLLTLLLNRLLEPTIIDVDTRADRRLAK